MITSWRFFVALGLFFAGVLLLFFTIARMWGWPAAWFYIGLLLFIGGAQGIKNFD